MARCESYGSYEQFKNEILRHRAGPMVSLVDEIADEMFHVEAQDDFEELWDGADSDDD